MTAAATAGPRAETTAFTVLFGLSLAHLLNDMMQSLLPAIYPTLKDQFHLNFLQIGLVTLTFQLTASLLQPLVGLYADKRPSPFSLPIGMVFTLGGLILLAFTPTYGLLLLAAALIGMGSSVLHPEASRVARMASGGRRGLAQSVFQVGGNAGSSLGPIAALVVGSYGQRSIAWFALAALSAILVLWRIGLWYKHHGLARLKAETAERERAEASLRQSQKMEAVGQLTGGIAHDFNNMLTGVIGSLDFMRRRLAAGKFKDLDRYLDTASASAARAASLTQRLLAFSRRQSLDPMPADINELIVSMSDLMDRAVNERIDLKLVLAPDLPAGVVDTHQLENAILNLVLNARDAMPEGGALTVETSTVDLDEAQAAARPGLSPGRYLVIAVSDTGVGMSPELIEKVFDPFFTTKPLGQGTGLGLSMVYGFARQSGGAAAIHSQVGVGTSVKLFLPTTDARPAPTTAVAGSAPRGRGERVLVIEDDPAVRMLVREVLEELHYQAVEFADPLAAAPYLASDERIDLMISDVGLPGMSGRELAETARASRPDLPILFITGYAENAAIRAGFLGANMAMVSKPFSFEDLAAKVSQMIASPAA